MITKRQRAIAAKVADDLRRIATLIEETVDDHEGNRIMARFTLRRQHLNRHGELYTHNIDNPNGRSLLYDYCSKCGVDVEGTADLCEECQESETAEQEIENAS